MRNLLTDPLWQAEDLGKPIPDSTHAVSVALPLWQHVVGYEEEDPAILEQLNCGYPRFFCHPLVMQLFHQAQNRFASKNQNSLVFPSRRVAQQCVNYIKTKTGAPASIDDYGLNNLHVVTFAADQLETARQFWRYSGQIVSSRLAQATLEAKEIQTDTLVLDKLKVRIAQWSGQRTDDVFLFGSGMGAIYTVQNMLQEVCGPGKTVQLEFPYVDVLRVQKEFGPGVHFYPIFRDDDITILENLLQQETIAGVYCEIPSNPLMRSVNLAKLSDLLKFSGVPLIVDDTIGTCINIDVSRFADVVTTSLTKYFSGVGDVIAGSMLINNKSRFYARFNEYLMSNYENLFCPCDAEVLEANSRDYPQRVRQINQTAQQIYTYLNGHPQIEKVFYPTAQTAEAYGVALKVKAEEGGGGLISILLKDAFKTTPSFYDALSVSKGPSLGTNFTLVCPYMLLAHYQELDWAESCGASRYLIRISIGLEAADDLINRLDKAFAAIR